ncbi:MAG: AAA family ATPase [Armatimonadetes bacterium]|nr:AAA family ATPase [Armatimonadota bacterium]
MPTATTEHTRIRGEVERVFFSSASFSAGRFITERGDRIQFAGNVVVSENQPLVLHGKFIKHPKYGLQFEVTSMEFDRQLDARGLANYLANDPGIKGIGPSKARLIAEQFGANFERSLVDEPEKIAEVAKVPLSVIESLRDHWLETSHINQAMTALAAYGLTHHQVTKLVKKLGNNAVSIIERDPYLIVGEIDGFGFKRIDKIARQVGIEKDEPSRIRAGIVFCVEDALDQGDCWVEYEDLLGRANELLVMDCLDSREQIERHLDNLIDEKALTCYSADCRFLVAKPLIRSIEEDLARVFAGGAKSSPRLGDKSNLQAEVKRVAPRLNPKQFDAAISAAAHSISLISGGAGSGKTFTVAAITRLCDEHDLRVVLCAPTGKAAKRMEETTGRDASTIHRLLGFNGKTYSRDSENPISTDVLIVDEVSMVDVVLAWHLFQAIDLERTSVVLVGDHNQLPPVGPGNILRDLIESRSLPTTILDDIVRQAGILKENSIAILRGEVRKTPQRDTSVRGAWYVADQHTEAERVQRFILDLFEHTLKDKLGFDILRDVQLLTPTHKGPLGTVELNIKLQRLIQRKLWNVFGKIKVMQKGSKSCAVPVALVKQNEP